MDGLRTCEDSVDFLIEFRALSPSDETKLESLFFKPAKISSKQPRTSPPIFVTKLAKLEHFRKMHFRREIYEVQRRDDLPADRAQGLRGLAERHDRQLLQNRRAELPRAQNWLAVWF